MLVLDNGAFLEYGGKLLAINASHDDSNLARRNVLFEAVQQDSESNL